MDAGDGQTKDWTERGQETGSNQTQVGSGATTERGNEIVWGHGRPATRDEKRRQRTFELGICPPQTLVTVTHGHSNRTGWRPRGQLSFIAPPFIQRQYGTARSPPYTAEAPSSTKRGQGRGQPCRSNAGQPGGLTSLATKPQDRILDLANTCPFDLKKPGAQRYVYKCTRRNSSDCFSVQPRHRRS